MRNFVGTCTSKPDLLVQLLGVYMNIRPETDKVIEGLKITAVVSVIFLCVIAVVVLSTTSLQQYDCPGVTMVLT